MRSSDINPGAVADGVTTDVKSKRKAFVFTPNRRQTPRKKRLGRLFIGLSALLVIGMAWGLWLVSRAVIISENLEAAGASLYPIKEQLQKGKANEALALIPQLREYTEAAEQAATDPLWKTAAALPGVGSNFSAVTETALSARDVVDRALVPIVSDPDLLNLENLSPSEGSVDLPRLERGVPKLLSAARVVRLSHERLNAIDASQLIPAVAEPLTRTRSELATVTTALDAAANTAQLAPVMLGSTGPRNYVLIIQNNAEARATGGIPGALARLTADKGHLELGEQTTAGGLGSFDPPIDVDSGQEEIYSKRLGKFVQDINLTPAFPTTASTAKAMWERKTGEKIDGVISIDPVALGYILEATGPVQLADPRIRSIGSGMPDQLTSANVVKTLLSDVYSKIPDTRQQDAYFAAVASEVFGALSSGRGEAKGLIESLVRGSSEHRILVWSTHEEEQNVLSRYPLSGSISGQSVSSAQIGVFFNDGTGAKMDYYVKRKVQLIEQCPEDGYNQVTVRVTSTNTAPADAGTSLPAYVTGGGVFGIPPGSVQTNVVAYGPSQAHVESATQDGAQIPFGAQRHDERPVGTVTTLLAPGQSTTVEFNFGHIVQHAQPELVVTPTTESVKNVIQSAQQESCNSVE